MVKRTQGVNLDKIIKELDRKVIKTGYFEHSRYEDGTPVAYIASIHELGSLTKNIPPRPTLHPAMEKNKKKYSDAIIRGVKAAAREQIKIDDVLEQIGQLSSGDVGEEISNLESPKLHRATIRARERKHHAGKASDKPLVDTGLMIQSVTHRVEDK